MSKYAHLLMEKSLSEKNKGGRGPHPVDVQDESISYGSNKLAKVILREKVKEVLRLIKVKDEEKPSKSKERKKDFGEGEHKTSWEEEKGKRFLGEDKINSQKKY